MNGPTTSPSLAVPANPLLAEPLTAALAYASCQWPVLPLTPRGKTPLGTLAPNGLHNATVNESVIRAWWAEEPHANPRALRYDHSPASSAIKNSNTAGISHRSIWFTTVTPCFDSATSSARVAAVAGV